MTAPRLSVPGPRRTPMASACALCLSMMLSAPLQAQSDREVAFTIPAQSLQESLVAFTAQSGAQVTVSGGMDTGVISSLPLDGRYTPREALTRLAAESGLVVRENGSGDFILERPADDNTSLSRRNVQTLEVIGQPIDSVIDSEAIARKQANDLEDLFSGVPTVMAGGSVGAAQKLYVRNLGEDTLNVMVDGATQAGVTYHHTGRISIEPELLKQVEVQVGAGEATNGPGALGGAIRFATKDPDDLLEPDARFGALVKTGYFSNTDGTKVSLSGYGRLNDDWGLLGSLVKADHDNIEDGEGNTIAGTDSKQELQFLKLSGRPADGHRLSLSHERLSEEGNKARRPEWAPGPGNPAWFLEFERRTSTFNYGYNPAGQSLLGLDVTAYLTEFDIFRPIDQYTSAIESKGLIVQNTSRFGSHELTYGVDHRDDVVTAGELPTTSEEEENSSVTGVFVQNHHQLTDSLMLSYGMRYDRFELTDNDNDDFDESGVSPNLGFSWQSTDRLRFSGGYAAAVRGPETNDGFKLFGTTNDPNLEAETAHNVELGADYQLGRFSFSAGLHDVTIEDAIGNALPWSRHYENLGDIDSSGYTLGMNYSANRLELGLNFMDTKAELDGEQLTRYAYGYLGTTTGDVLTINLNYYPAPAWSLGWIGELVSGVNDIYVSSADATIDKPGFGVHDLFVQWQPLAMQGFSLTLTLRNVFDKQYLDHGSIEDFTHIPDYGMVVGPPSAGRDIRLTASYDF